MNKYPILYDAAVLKFRRVTSNSDILTLLKIFFNQDFKKDYLNWLSACPTGANKWYGAFEKDQPVALYGLLPIKVRIGGVLYPAVLCNNVGVVLKYQGRGLFQSLGEYALKDADSPIGICVPNAQAVRGHRRIGWQSYGVLELLSRSIEEKDLKYVGYDEFICFPRKEVYFYIEKDLDFIKWRYSKPGMKYYQSFFGKDDYIIWKYYNAKQQIMELTNYKLAVELGGTVDLWQFRGTNFSEDLKSKGFVPVLSNEFLLYTSLQIANDLNVFNFELGDNDGF